MKPFRLIYTINTCTFKTIFYINIFCFNNGTTSHLAIAGTLQNLNIFVIHIQTHTPN